MNLVVDANVFAAYYRASVLEADIQLCGDPIAIFDRLGGEDTALLDQKGMIAGEWSKRVSGDEEWFDAWLATRLADGGITEIAIDNCKVLLQKLWNDCGLPKQSRDKWYVRTAHTQARRAGETTAIVTEDVDFFEPAAKGDPKKRKKHLRSGKGKVAKVLRKHMVDPRTTRQHPSS